MAYFTEHDVFKIHPCCNMCQNVLFLRLKNINIPLHVWDTLVFPFTRRWTPALLPPFGCCEHGRTLSLLLLMVNSFKDPGIPVCQCSNWGYLRNHFHINQSIEGFFRKTDSLSRRRQLCWVPKILVLSKRSGSQRGGQFSLLSRGHLAMCYGVISGCHDCGWAANSIQGVETRDAVNILYCTGHPYTTENELAPNTSSAKAEKSASKETCFHSAPGPKGSSR